jgi:hypothetical protein
MQRLYVSPSLTFLQTGSLNLRDDDMVALYGTLPALPLL